MIIRRTTTILLVLMALAPNAWAISGSQATVEAAISAAASGATITIDAGSWSWTSLAIAKPITLQGAGIGNTIVTVSACTITKQATGKIILTGFSFAKTGGGNESQAWYISGAWDAEPVVIYNCRHDISVSGLYRVETIGGVIFSGNQFYGEVDDSFIQTKLPGDTVSWTTDHTMGTADTDGAHNIYIEGNYFHGGANQGVDADDATRVVFRYNRCDYMSFNSHGLATSDTGVRTFEVYSNEFRNDSAGGWTGGETNDDLSNQNKAIWIRGGTGVITANVIDDIANSYWGYIKPEMQFDVRTQQDNSGSTNGTLSPPVAKYSAGQGNYPRERQLGQGWDSSLSNTAGINGGVGDYILDPIYIWGNTGAGTVNGGPLGLGEGSWGDQTGYFNLNRDYYIGTARPGWSPSTCPNPNVGSGSCSGAGNAGYSVTLAGYEPPAGAPRRAIAPAGKPIMIGGKRIAVE